ncbi:MAG: hypothetical protein M3R58_01360 [Pseudomonadota bacterium]|nr:hypothetical protein [Pseudomonadota bacterium]
MEAITANDKYSGAVEVTLARSRIVPAFVAAAAGATVALIAFTPLPLDAALALATGTACLALDALRRSRPIRLLAVDCSGALSVDGVAGELRDGSFVAPWLTIVRWRPARARFDRTLLIVADMLPAADFRHLRVILKWR